MGARSGGSGSGFGSGSQRITPQEMKAAAKDMQSAQANLTKAEKKVKYAMGGYYLAKTPEAKIKAIEKVSFAQDNFKKAQAKFDFAKSVYDAKNKTYQKGAYLNPKTF